MVWDSGCRSGSGMVWGLAGSQELESSHWPPARQELNSTDHMQNCYLNFIRLLRECWEPVLI